MKAHASIKAKTPTEIRAANMSSCVSCPRFSDNKIIVAIGPPKNQIAPKINSGKRIFSRAIIFV